MNARQTSKNLDSWLQSYVQFSLYILNPKTCQATRNLFVLEGFIVELSFMDSQLNFKETYQLEKGCGEKLFLTVLTLISYNINVEFLHFKISTQYTCMS